MSLTGYLVGLFGLALAVGCTPQHAIHVGGEDVAERYTTDPPALAFPKLLEAAQRQSVTITRADEPRGTFQGTAYRGKVAVFAKVDTKGSHTRLGAVARLEPGTFSHGQLDLADRILAAYPEGN